MGWESQLNRNEMSRQSAALNNVAQRLGDVSETLRNPVKPDIFEATYEAVEEEDV